MVVYGVSCGSLFEATDAGCFLFLACLLALLVLFLFVFALVKREIYVGDLRAVLNNNNCAPSSAGNSSVCSYFAPPTY